MLLPGTFGSPCWYTRVTLAFFDFGASARTQGGDKQRTEDAFHGAVSSRLADEGSGCCR